MDPAALREASPAANFTKLIAMFEISVDAAFAASHAIRLPDGSLEPLHGHNWPVRVTVASDTLDGIETVMDFHDLEKLVASILAPWHNRHLNDVAPFTDGQGGLAVNCSAERVAWWIGEEVKRQLPPRVRFLSAAVGEAPGCTATYRA